MKLLASYLSGAWSAGSGSRIALVNPATEAGLAEVHDGGHDLAAAVGHARAAGLAELGRLSFAERGALLAGLAKAVHGAREELIALAVGNGGNTRSDAKFDVDGATFTLSSYAQIGQALGDARFVVDGEGVQLGRTPRDQPPARLYPRFAQRSGQRQERRLPWRRRQPSTRRLSKIQRQ